MLPLLKAERGNPEDHDIAARLPHSEVIESFSRRASTYARRASVLSRHSPKCPEQKTRQHYAAGIGIGLYTVAASISGSIIVYRNELSLSLAVEWLIK
jgi:hypothetical protein